MSNTYQNLVHNFIQVNSTNQPSWSSYCYIDFNTPEYCIHECTFQITLDGITGISSGAQCAKTNWFVHLAITKLVRIT